MRLKTFVKSGVDEVQNKIVIYTHERTDSTGKNR